MSRERARRREERERELAIQAAARAADAERRERRTARRRLVTDRLPGRLHGRLPGRLHGRLHGGRKSSRPMGILAERRRHQLQATVGLLVLLNVAAWLVVHDLPTQVLLLVVTLLVAPVVHLLLWRR